MTPYPFESSTYIKNWSAVVAGVVVPHRTEILWPGISKAISKSPYLTRSALGLVRGVQVPVGLPNVGTSGFNGREFFSVHKGLGEGSGLLEGITTITVSAAQFLKQEAFGNALVGR